ncbi:MAG: penicillin-binding protein, partial [Bacteroidetes bacterium]|nr:penicillin-binding protein [Bacteroidota bacterium]
DYSVNDEQVRQLWVSAMKRTDRYKDLVNKGMNEEQILDDFNKPIPMKIFSWDKEIDTLMSPMDSIRYYKWFLRAGFVSMEPTTGFVKAYVGGQDYRHFQYDHARAARQVGSTFKPFVYAKAFEDLKYKPCDKVPNIQVIVEFDDGRPPWIPANSYHKHEGEMVTLKWGLANSINWISAFLMKRVKPGPVIQLAKKMGITSEIPEVYSICLGTADISLLEMVGAFSVYANKGWYIEPTFVTRIEDKDGNLIESFIPEKTEALSEETAFLMLGMLRGVVEMGTGQRLRYKYQFSNTIAGKTGTTQNNSDGWFMGLTPDLVSGVWVGAEDRSVHFRSTALGQGANMALPIWALYMKKVYADKSLKISMGDFDGITKYKDDFNCV